MRENKILVCLALLLAFVAGISAQEKTTQEELSIENLLKLEDVTTLRFLVSTKEEVNALYGEKCDYNRCHYKDGWSIHFEFAASILDFYLSNPTVQDCPGRMDRTWVKPEFKGTLVEVELFQRWYGFPENYSLPPDFDCTKFKGDTYCNNGETFIRYWSRGIRITHRVSVAQYKQITGEKELQRTPPKNFLTKESVF